MINVKKYSNLKRYNYEIFKKDFYFLKNENRNL